MVPQSNILLFIYHSLKDIFHHFTIYINGISWPKEKRITLFCRLIPESSDLLELLCVSTKYILSKMTWKSQQLFLYRTFHYDIISCIVYLLIYTVPFSHCLLNLRQAALYRSGEGLLLRPEEHRLRPSSTISKPSWECMTCTKKVLFLSSFVEQSIKSVNRVQVLIMWY